MLGSSGGYMVRYKQNVKVKQALTLFTNGQMKEQQRKQRSQRDHMRWIELRNFNPGQSLLETPETSTNLLNNFEEVARASCNLSQNILLNSKGMWMSIPAIQQMLRLEAIFGPNPINEEFLADILVGRIN
jgi:hypothetical protein